MEYPFLTKEIIEKLLDNGSKFNQGKDHVPVVRLFTPDANANWLLTELLPDVFDIAFGLCDLGLGFPELGYVSLHEIASVRGVLGLPIERDTNFEGKYPLSIYTEAARMKQCITDDPGTLEYITRKIQTKSPSPKLS